MGKIILTNLFKTFVLSVICSIVGLSVLHLIVQKGFEFNKVLPLILVAALYLNAILTLMAAPALLLSNNSFWDKPVIRVFLYFSGPVAFIITDFTLPMSNNDTIAYIIVGVIFVIIHSFFFYKLLQSKK
ncbi:MAG TPA: hypothetical protein VHA56_07565 [Mucilaginibacter sp.]|nr:hypothetical protein [Mucilaginibacter sp.]